MPRKPYREFVRAVASIVDHVEHLIAEDDRVQQIYWRPVPYRDRVSFAVSYWRARPDYIDVNR